MVLLKINTKIKKLFIGGCIRKKKYTLKKAIERMNYLKSVDKVKSKQLNVYKCSFCEQYHVGHISQSTLNKYESIKNLPKFTLYHLQH